MLYDYTIKPDADMTSFSALSLKMAAIPGIEKRNRIVDVDGSIMDFYSHNNKEIIAHIDYYVGAIYIESDVDLSELIADFGIDEKSV